MSKWIQSHLTYSQDFGIVGATLEGGDPAYVDIPGKREAKNIVEVSDAQFDWLSGIETFADHVKAGLFRVLDNLPKRYQDTAQVVAGLNAEKADLQTKIEEAGKLTELQAKEIADLKAKLSAWEDGPAKGGKKTKADEKDEEKQD